MPKKIKLSERNLDRLREKITAIKDEQSELAGERKALIKRLKDEFDCSSVSEAEELMESLQEEITTAEGELNEEWNDLIKACADAGIIEID
jgi:predicted transcriptional regulator